MKNLLAVTIALAAWFAVVTQYILMIGNRVAPVGETTIRFFSFFTILTNILVAIVFTRQAWRAKVIPEGGSLNSAGQLTAVAVYITVIGLVYQVVLRPLWDPQGLQWVVDELLHSVIPALVIVYWYKVEGKHEVPWTQLPVWLIYPSLYLAFLLVRGWYSQFYPYPFVNVSTLGIRQVVVNAVILLVLFSFLSAVFLSIGRVLHKAQRRKISS